MIPVLAVAEKSLRSAVASDGTVEYVYPDISAEATILDFIKALLSMDMWGMLWVTGICIDEL